MGYKQASDGWSHRFLVRDTHQNADAHCGRFSHCDGCVIKACFSKPKNTGLSLSLTFIKCL